MDTLSKALNGALERALTGDAPALGLDDLVGKSRTDIEEAVRVALQDPGLLEALSTPDLMSQLLLDMAAKGDRDSCLGAIQRGADIHRLNDDHESALHLATKSHYLPCVGLLLRAGVRVDAFAPAVGTALHIAARSGDEAMALLLLDAGSDPHQPDPSGAATVELMRADHLEQFRAFAHYARDHDERKDAAERLAAYIAGALPSALTPSQHFQSERHHRLYLARPWSEEAHRCGWLPPCSHDTDCAPFSLERQRSPLSPTFLFLRLAQCLHMPATAQVYTEADEGGNLQPFTCVQS